MRSDMSKIIVERPRWGHQASYARGARKNAFSRDLEAAPSREPVGMGRYAEKELSENLSPLYRFLRTNLGRPWDKVWSEMCSHISFDSAVQKHILQHVFDVVAKHVTLIEGVPHIAKWNRTREPLVGCGRWPALYVCPKSGLLRQAKHLRRKERQRRRNAVRENPDIRVLADGGRLWRIAGIWYRVDMATASSSGELDIVLQTKVPAGTLRAVSKRQLGTREIVRYGLTGS